MILVWVCTVWAAEPSARRSETRLSAMAVVRTESRIFTGEGLDVAVSHQFPVPLVLGLEGLAGFDHGPRYELGPDYSIVVDRHGEPTVFGVWVYAGYTVRVRRIDATPMLRVSGEGIGDISATLRWWWSDHWSLQGQLGPYQLAYDVDKGLFDLGFGVAWRPRAPHAEK